MQRMTMLGSRCSSYTHCVMTSGAFSSRKIKDHMVSTNHLLTRMHAEYEKLSS